MITIHCSLHDIRGAERARHLAKAVSLTAEVRALCVAAVVITAAIAVYLSRLGPTAAVYAAVVWC
jgi:hypothetical protein